MALSTPISHVRSMLTNAVHIAARGTFKASPTLSGTCAEAQSIVSTARLWADTPYASTSPHLVKYARELFTAVLAPNSRSSHSSEQKSFLDFCKAHVSNPISHTQSPPIALTYVTSQSVHLLLQAQPVDVCMWMAAHTARGLQAKTVDH